MEKLYCTIFVVDISQNPDEVETVSSRVQQLIEDHGGIIKKVNNWGKRRLAYEIDKKSHGFYVEVEFTANSHLNIPKTLEGEYRLNDRVLRNMTYIITKEELVQRAKDSGKAQQKEAPKAAAPKEKSSVEEKKPKSEEKPKEPAAEEESKEEPKEETSAEEANTEKPSEESTEEKSGQ